MSHVEPTAAGLFCIIAEVLSHLDDDTGEAVHHVTLVPTVQREGLEDIVITLRGDELQPKVGRQFYLSFERVHEA